MSGAAYAPTWWYEPEPQCRECGIARVPLDNNERCETCWEATICSECACDDFEPADLIEIDGMRVCQDCISADPDS